MAGKVLTAANEGAWIVERHPHSGHPLVADRDGYVVADCGNSELPPEQEEANARLIAAAPDFADAAAPIVKRLEDALASLPEVFGPVTDHDAVTVTVGELRRLQAALARARGETGGEK